MVKPQFFLNYCCLFRYVAVPQNEFKYPAKTSYKVVTGTMNLLLIWNCNSAVWIVVNKEKKLWFDFGGVRRTDIPQVI